MPYLTSLLRAWKCQSTGAGWAWICLFRGHSAFGLYATKTQDTGTRRGRLQMRIGNVIKVANVTLKE